MGEDQPGRRNREDEASFHHEVDERSPYGASPHRAWSTGRWSFAALRSSLPRHSSYLRKALPRFWSRFFWLGRAAPTALAVTRTGSVTTSTAVLARQPGRRRSATGAARRRGSIRAIAA